MSENTAAPVDTAVPVPGPRNLAGLTRLAHLIYLLHTIAVLIGISSAATIVGAFVFGFPSIVAVILNYIKRDETRGTFLESHFRWQIRTFWFALLWCVLSGVLFLTLIGIPIAIALAAAAGIWVIYRVVRGWMLLNDGKPMPV